MHIINLLKGQHLSKLVMLFWQTVILFGKVLIMKLPPYSVQRMYELTKEKAKGKKVIITETGWPSKGKVLVKQHPTEENAMKFFINIQKWSAEKELNYSTSHLLMNPGKWLMKVKWVLDGAFGIKMKILKYG
jgi:hypothetical protein